MTNNEKQLVELIKAADTPNLFIPLAAFILAEIQDAQPEQVQSAVDSLRQEYTPEQFAEALAEIQAYSDYLRGKETPPQEAIDGYERSIDFIKQKFIN